MPGAWQVTLSEALSIQGKPLDEQQIWAILSEAVQGIQDYFCRGEAVLDGAPAFAVTPDTMYLCRGGNIQYASSSVSSVRNTDFIPPESETLQPDTVTPLDVEKMYVFSLGLTVYWAADYKLGTDQELELGELLDQVLSAMCEEDPSLRVPLDKLSQVCLEYRQNHPAQPPNAYVIRNLYQLLMGSSSDLDHMERVHRENSRRARNRPRDHSNSRQQTRSRSRCRSRSRSRDNHSHRNPQRKRPHPIGRDHTAEDRYPDHVSMRSHSSHARSDRYPMPPTQYVTMLPTQDYTYPYYSGYAGNIPSAQRKVLSEIQPDIYDPINKDSSKLPPGVIPPPAQWAFPGIVYNDPPQNVPSVTVKDPVRKQHMQKAYGRLRDRGARLQALRQGLDLEDVSDITSLYSDLTDVGERKSMISGNSSSHGVFIPDLVHDARQQTDVGLRVQSPVRPRLLDQDAEWIRKQEAEIEAMIMAQNAFIHETRDTGDGARSEPDSVMATAGTMATPAAGTLPRRDRSKPQQHVPRSRDTSASRGRKQPSKSRERSHSRPRARPFYGPEFVQDHGTLTVHTPEARSLPPGKVRHLEVILLTGQKLDIICDVNNISKEVSQTVTAYLNLPEAFYFGLTYVHEREHLFLEPDAPIHKVAPKSWKTQNIGGFTVHLRIKFYTDVFNHLRHETTRHLYYLQVRRDLLEERCWCTPSQMITLSALAVQAEYNDHIIAGTKHWTPDHYFPPRTLRKVGKAYARDQVMDKLRQFEGMNEKNAEINFLKEAMLLPEYGIHFYHIHKSKSDTLTPLWVGISVQGILIAEQETGGNRRVLHRHSWTGTQKVSYNKRRFSVQPKPDANVGKLPKLNFFTETYKKCRYLTQLCTSHHRYQMMSRLNSQPNEIHMTEQDFEYDLDEYDSQSASPDNSPRQQDMDTEDELEDAAEFSQPQPHTSHSGQSQPRSQSGQSQPHSHSGQSQPRSQSGQSQPRSQSGQSLPHSQSGQSQPHSQSGQSQRISQPHYHAPQNDNSYDEYSDQELLEEPGTSRVSSARSENTQPQQFNGSVGTAHVLDVLEDSSVVPMSDIDDSDLISYKAQARKVEIVRLPRDPRLGYGVTIVGGNNTGKLDFGIFVKSVTPNSPADMCRKIHPGDRVLAVNGQSLEGMPHSVAVEMIRESPQLVELTLSQNVQNLGVDQGLTQSGESLNIATAERNIVITSSDKPQRTVPASQEFGNVPRPPSSVASSDVELEDVLPPEALHLSNLNKMAATSNNMTVVAAVENFEDASDDELAGFHDNLNASGPRPGSSVSNQKRTPSSPKQLQPGDQYQLILEKKQNSFGLNVTGGINTSVKQGGIYVKSMTRDGAADQDNRISIGDRVIEVNGVSLLRVTHKQAVETLRSAPSSCTLVMEKGMPPSGRQSHQSPSTPSIGNTRSLALSPNSLTESTGAYTPDGMNSSLAGSIYSPHNTSSQEANSMSMMPHGGKDLLMEYYPFVTKAFY